MIKNKSMVKEIKNNVEIVEMVKEELEKNNIVTIHEKMIDEMYVYVAEQEIAFMWMNELPDTSMLKELDYSDSNDCDGNLDYQVSIYFEKLTYFLKYLLKALPDFKMDFNEKEKRVLKLSNFNGKKIFIRLSCNAAEYWLNALERKETQC